MSNAHARVHLACGIVAIGLLSTIIPCSSYAQNSDRIGQLEKEIREIKLRLSRLEGNPGDSRNSQNNVLSSDRWKSKSNWRQLKTGMSTDDVRKLLGEPWYIKGGSIEFWYYQKGTMESSLTFVQGHLNEWQEPQ
jgi:hypothetical protein